MSSYLTADCHVLADEDLEREAEAFERGERPAAWHEPGTQSLSVDLPAWIVASADAEARRVNVSRRAIINMWLAEKAEQSDSRRRAVATA